MLNTINPPHIGKMLTLKLRMEANKVRNILTIVFACYCESMMEIKIPGVSCGGVFLLHQSPYVFGHICAFMVSK